jgi:predicted ATPase/class 3 adenylate cyclase
VAGQPTGTVSLLFTDIEGSTRLLGRLGTDCYRESLDRYRELLRGAAARHGGYEVDCEGDSFFFAFSSAVDALAAAAQAQHAHLVEDWPRGLPVRVRIGIHTGSPLAVPPKYVGLDVHRAARIMAAAHGGQVLLSAETRQHAPEAEVVSLGEHRLKDIDQPEPLYQLVVEGAPGEFPALRTLGNQPTNLPSPPTPFVGRERERAEVAALVVEKGVRLVTVTGAGGVGKTRFAMQVASDLLGEFESGAFVVFLAGLEDPDLVAASIADTLALREIPGESIEETLTRYLLERRMLLVLDNLEHLPAAALLLGRLVASCPRLVMLATSRSRLRLRSERLYELPPLRDEEGVKLLRLRAEAVSRTSIAEGDEALPEIVRRLDGLPLALELAAPSLRTLSPAALSRRLERVLDLLVDGPFDVEERQRTMRAAVEWSFNLLPPKARTLFARCAVFIDGAEIDAVEAVTGGTTAELATLVDASLASVAAGRLRILQPLREFAGEKLTASGEVDDVQLRHARYFASQVEAADARLEEGDESAFAVFDLDRGNIRAALATLRAKASPGLLAAVTACGWYWYIRGYLTEGRRWLDESLAGRTATEAPALVAKALMRHAAIAEFQGDLETAEHDLREAITIRRRLVDATGVAAALSNLGGVMLRHGALEAAESAYEEALTIDRDANRRPGIAAGLCNLGITALLKHDYDTALELLEASRLLASELGNRYGLASVDNNIAQVALETGRSERAAAAIESSLRIARDLNAVDLTAGALETAAQLALAVDDSEGATFLLGGADAIRAEHGMRPIDIGETRQRTIHRAEEALGTEVFQRQYEDGRTAGAEAVLAAATAVCQGAPAAAD